MTTEHTLRVTAEQFSATLTGLHLLEDRLRNDRDFEISDLYLLVHTDDGAHAGLTASEVAKLREDLNAGSVKPMHFSGNTRETLLMRTALQHYASLLASPTSADRVAYGDDYADEECDLADRMLDAMPLAEFPDEVVDEVTRHYIVAALWSTTDGEDGNLDDTKGVDDLSPELAQSAREDCKAFLHANVADALLYSDQIDTSEYTWEARFGHDFWLTRAGHGVGFWDRGLGDLGQRLTAAAKTYANEDWYIGDDGKVYA